MNFGAAAQLLIDTIKRPDKLSDAKAAINNGIAILAVRPFARDAASAVLTLDSATYLQTFDITTTPFTRFRKVKWLRPAGYKKYITWRDPSRVFVDGCECLDVYYLEGVNLIFKLSALQSTANIGYYRYHATLTANTDEDWMIDMMWPAVRAYGLYELFGQIGDDMERARYEKEYLRFWDIFHADLGDGVDN